MGISENATISSLYRNGGWRLPPVRSDPQLQLYTYLTTIQLQESEDYYEWEINGSIYETYQTGVLYDYLRQPMPDMPWTSLVWISRGVPRHSFHSWLVIQNRLPTRDRLLSWGLQTDDRCLLCNAAQETRDHIFFSCTFSFDLWLKVTRRLDLLPQRSWDDTIMQMTSLPPPQWKRNLDLQAWQSTMHWLWNERNTRMHASTFRSTDCLFRLLDQQLRNKLQSFRDSNPTKSSLMMQSWFRVS